jgi:hypothetical protein
MNILAEYEIIYKKLNDFFDSTDYETLESIFENKTHAQVLIERVNFRHMYHDRAIKYCIHELSLNEQERLLDYIQINPELKKIENYFSESEEIYTLNHIQGHTKHDWLGEDLKKNQLAICFHEEPSIEIQQAVEYFIENKFDVQWYSGDAGLIIVEGRG